MTLTTTEYQIYRLGDSIKSVTRDTVAVQHSRKRISSLRIVEAPGDCPLLGLSVLLLRAEARKHRTVKLRDWNAIAVLKWLSVRRDRDNFATLDPVGDHGAQDTFFLLLKAMIGLQAPATPASLTPRRSLATTISWVSTRNRRLNRDSWRSVLELPTSQKALIYAARHARAGMMHAKRCFYFYNLY